MIYQSEISVEELVQTVLEGINAAPEIPPTVVAQYLQDLQCRLYDTVFRPKRKDSLFLQKAGQTSYTDFASIIPETGEDQPAIEDLTAILLDERPVYYTEPERFFCFSFPVYTRMADKIFLRNVPTEGISALYTVRPAPIYYSEALGYQGSICMPKGYTCLLEAGLRAELCRHIEDDEGYKRHMVRYNDLLLDLKLRFGAEEKGLNT